MCVKLQLSDSRCSTSSRRPAPSGRSVMIRRLVRELVPPRLDVRDADARREAAEHRRVVERVADVDVRREVVDVAAEHLAHDRACTRDSLSKCGGPKLTCTLERTAAKPAFWISCTHISASSRDSETSSFQSIARSTSRYFESLDSRAPGTFDITSTATSFMRRRHSGRLAAGTPYCLTSLRPSRTNVTPPFSATHAEHRRHLHERVTKAGRPARSP